MKGRAGLKRKQGQVFAPHAVSHVGPGRKDAFAPDIRPLIEQMIEDAQGEIGHADFVSIGKTEGIAQERPERLFGCLRHGLNNAVPFPTGVARRLFDRRKQMTRQVDS